MEIITCKITPGGGGGGGQNDIYHMPYIAEMG